MSQRKPYSLPRRRSCITASSPVTKKAQKTSAWEAKQTLESSEWPYCWNRKYKFRHVFVQTLSPALIMKRGRSGTSLRILSSCVTHVCNALMVYRQIVCRRYPLCGSNQMELRLLDPGAELPSIKLCWVPPGRTSCYINSIWRQSRTEQPTTS